MSLQAKKILISAAATVVVVGGFLVAPAIATPGSGFVPSSVAAFHYDALDVKADKDAKWDLFLKTKDDTDIGVDKLTVDPGGQSGWHTHAGPTFVTVKTGEITWYDGVLCSWRIYHAGDSFIEAPNHSHMVVNAGADTAEFIAIQIRPKGTPGRIDAPLPANCHF